MLAELKLSASAVRTLNNSDLASRTCMVFGTWHCPLQHRTNILILRPRWIHSLGPATQSSCFARRLNQASCRVSRFFSLGFEVSGLGSALCSLGSLSGLFGFYTVNTDSNLYLQLATWHLGLVNSTEEILSHLLRKMICLLKTPSKMPGWGLGVYLPLVSREWRNGVQLYLLLLPFFHSLLTKGRSRIYG